MYELRLRIKQSDGSEHQIMLDVPAWMLDETDPLHIKWDRITELALLTPSGYPFVVFGAPLKFRPLDADW